MSAIDARLRFDASYMSTTSGIVKLGCLILAIASIISNNVGGYNIGAIVFYNVVVIMGFWYTLILLIFYVCHVIEKFYGLPWLRTELVCTGLMIILYMIASIIIVVTSSVAQIIAGIFGFCTLGLYIFDFGLKLRKWRNGELAQGSLNSPSPNPPEGVTNSAFPG